MRPRFCSLQSKEGKSPLHMAAIHGRFTRSQILIQNGEWLLLQPRATPPLILWCSAPASTWVFAQRVSELCNYLSNSLLCSWGCCGGPCAW